MEAVESEAKLQQAVERLRAVRNEIAKVIVGQDDVVEGVLICLLASGHVLLEGVPGLGKTTLLRTLAPALRSPGAGRRNQPRHSENTVCAFGSNAGAHRHQRHHDPRTGTSLSGHG